MKISTSWLKYFAFLVITLNTAFYAKGQQIFANQQQPGRSGLLCVGCTVSDPDNAADGNLQTFSTINVSVGLLAETWQEVIFPGAGKVPGGTPVTIKLGTGNNLLSLQALGGITLRAYNGNTPVGSAIAANTLVSLLSNNNQVLLNLTPASTFDRIRVTLDGGVAGALSSVFLYDAYYRSPGAVPCNVAFDELNGISSGLLNLGLNIGGVVNPRQAIDNNISTASTLNAGVGLVGAYAQQTIIFNNLSAVGDSVRLTLSIPQNLLDLGVTSNISVSTFNGNTANNDELALGSGLLNLRLLDLSGSRRIVTVTYAPSKVFDRVQLKLGGGVANLLSTLNIHEVQRVIPRPVVSFNGTVAQNVQICSGNGVTLTAASIPDTQVSWYATATGGTPLFTGLSFTTPALQATTTYYVEASRTGCTDASERTPVTITVSAVPAAPLVAASNVTVCTGQTATFTAQTVAGISVKWYTSPTGEVPVYTGDSFTTVALTQNTTYYAEAVSSGQCVSAARTAVTATIVTPPAEPVGLVNNATICEGEIAVLAVGSPVSGITYNWYATATGGVALHTGNSFTSPALTSNTIYYLEAINQNGCASSSRAQVSVTVQAKPSNPVLAANANTVTAGQNATISVSNAQTGITYNWYTSLAAATPVFTGTSYQTPALYTSTTYYVSAVNATGCTSVSRTPVTVNVTINNNTPCSFANQQLGNINSLCIGCDISNRALAADADTTTASTIRVTAGLAGGYAEQELRFQQPGYAVDTVKLVLQTPIGLANIILLSQIEVALYNGTTEVSRYALNNSLVQVSALGGSNRYAVYIPATGVYDRVVVRLNSGAVSLLNTLQIFYAVQQYGTPVVNPASPEICKGSTATLNITSPPTGTFNWYTSPTGGSPVFTGTNFTTPALNTNTTYYIENIRNGCEGPVRYPIQILVNDVPAAPVAAVNKVTINSGQTATVAATPTANATINWYTSASGGTPVATGNTYTTPALTQNTTYYAESALGSCISDTRKPVAVVVNPIIIPDVAVTPPQQTVNPGQTATFTASSTTPGAVFNWYTTPTGGTPVFTGANFTTPGQFTNTTYYAEAVVPGTGAVSTTRAPAAIVVNQSGTNPVACDAAIGQTTDVNGLVCIGCSVLNAAGAVDNDRNTFSQLNVGVGLLNAYAQQTLRFAGRGHAGDSVVVELGIPGSLADVGLLSRISLSTYSGSTYNNDRFNVNSSLLNVSLLNGDSRFRIAFVAQQDFDRVEIRLNSAALGALTSLNIYDAAQEVAAPVITNQNVAACQGTQTTLTATVPAGVTVKWYTTLTGGTPVFTGASFTTPVLNATTTYYAEASKTATGCAQVVRTPATVTVTPVPNAPTIDNPTVTVCSGQPAMFTAQAVNGAAVNWYTTPTGGTPVFTGNAFNTGPLTATTTYYAEAIANGQCSSSTRTTVTANVNNVVADAVIAQTPVQVCSGSSAVLAATSAQQGVIFNWYNSPTGGTPVFTGAQFTTPALTANTSYYVEAASGTCTSSNRVKADVIVNPAPIAPVVAITPAGGQITSGQTATLTATSTTPGVAFNWYTTPTGGTPVFTGTTYTTPTLSANTTYYVESELTATGCISATRTPVNIIVNPVFSTNCDFASTQTTDVNAGLACVGCTVLDANNAVDTDTTNYSRLNILIGTPGSYVSQSLIFSEPGTPGDTVSVLLRFPSTIASVGVLGNIRIASFNGATYNNDGILLNNNAVRIQLLPGGQSALVRFAPQASFDRVEVRLNSALASVFNSVDVLYASKQVEAPQLTVSTVNICSGNTATFTVSNARNGVTYNWYTTTTGGTPVFTGTTFTTAALSATTTYYVESSRTANSCANPNRAAATVNVTQSPVNPVLAQASLSTCAGNVVTLTVTNANSATVNWYDAPIGGNLLFTGANFEVSPIASANYYAELVSGTCASPARTQATVTVSARPAVPSLVTANTQICAGSSATLQVASPETGVNYEWYTSPTGGAAVFTGATFTTPVITQNTTYYVQANTPGGCTNNGGRVAANITLGAQIAAPALSETQGQVCSGGNIAVSVVNPVAGLQYNWYSAATGGTLVFTGVTFPLNNLTATVSYYVEAANGAGCISAQRTQTAITVLPVPAEPQIQASAGGLNICAGNTTILTVSSPQANMVYRWFNALTGGTLLYTGTQFNTPALTANTTYYVEAADAGNCNPSARTTVTVTVTDLPLDVVLTSSTVAVCAGSTATFTVSSPQAGVTYQWFDSPARTNKLFEGVTFITGPITANTTFYVAGLNTTGCSSPNLITARVIIQPVPAAPVIANGNAVEICTGAQATLSIANAIPAYTYNWYTAATGGSPVYTGNSFTTAALSGSVSYYVEAVSSTGCTSGARTQVTVNITALPAAPVVTVQGSSANGSVCTGSTATLTATSTSGNVIFNWYTQPTGGTPVFTGATFTTQALTANTTYYVEAVNSAGGCASASRTAVIITVNDLPQDVALVAANVNVCAGSTATFTVSSPQAGVTYQWFDSPARTNKLFEGATFITGPIAANTSYYITAVNASGCSSVNSAIAQVTVQQTPSQPVIANGNSVQTCNGMQVTLSIANAQVGYTYNWYANASGGVPLFSGISFTTPALTGNATYYAEAVNSTGCASGTRTEVNVIANPIPATPIIAAQGGSGTASVCAGSSITLTATSTTPNVIFNWYTQATGGTLIFTGSTYTTAAILANTTYYVEAASNAAGCTSTSRAAIQVTINNTTAPAPQVNSAGLTICQNTAATLSIANADAAVTYSWYTSATSTSAVNTGVNFTTPVLLANTTYYVEASSSQSCAPSARVAVNVVVVSQPVTPVAANAVVNVCAGSTAILTVASPQQGVVYNWYTNPNGGTPVFTGTSFTTGPVSGNTAFYVGATNGSCNSPSLATVQVTVATAPGAPLVVSNNVNVCAGTQATLVVTNVQSGFTYNWYASATGGAPIFTGNSFNTPQVTAATVYYLEAANSAGCVSAIRTAVNVGVAAAPAAPQVSAQAANICPGSSTVLNAVATNPAVTINWYSSATGGSILYSGNSFTTPVINASTTYYAEAVNAGGCLSSVRTPVTVGVQAALVAPLVNVTAVTLSSITFKWNAVPGATGYEVSLDNGTTYSLPTSGATGLSHIVTGLQPGQSVTIRVRATGSTACQVNIVSLPVTGTTENPMGNGLFIPNAFSPNGDGNNDLFMVYGTSIKTMTLWIYDQWGELQFRSTNPSTGWDGTYKGKQQPVGVYVYILEATMNDGQAVTKKGTINLIR